MSPKQKREEEKRIRNKVLESNFRYPAPKAHADFIAIDNNVSEARAQGTTATAIYIAVFALI
jgi:hypothetical protein